MGYAEPPPIFYKYTKTNLYNKTLARYLAIIHIKIYTIHH